MHLVLLQILLDEASINGVHTNRLGDVSSKLLDLMTQFFNPDVNLTEVIGAHLGVASGRERYDIFLRQLVNDLVNEDGKIVDNWLADLSRLITLDSDENSTGRLGEAEEGNELGIKSTIEWQVMAILPLSRSRALTTARLNPQKTCRVAGPVHPCCTCPLIRSGCQLGSFVR